MEQRQRDARARLEVLLKDVKKTPSGGSKTSPINIPTTQIPILHRVR
jgi:hypothetical protein